MFFDLTPEEVEERISTEAGCLSLLMFCHFPDGKFCCRVCGGKKAWSLNKREHTIECVCGLQFSLTANTIFHKARIPLSKLFRLVYDIGSGLIKSAHAFAKCVEISHASAWRWVQKLSIVVDNCRLIEKTGQIPQDTVERVIFRRSDQSLPKPLADRQVDRFLSTPKKESAKPFVVRTEHAADTAADEPGKQAMIAAGFIKFIGKTFQGVSSKYVQRYGHIFSFKLTLTLPRFESLLMGCVHSAPIDLNEITVYLSPPVLAMDAPTDDL